MWQKEIKTSGEFHYKLITGHLFNSRRRKLEKKLYITTVFSFNAYFTQVKKENVNRKEGIHLSHHVFFLILLYLLPKIDHTKETNRKVHLCPHTPQTARIKCIRRAWLCTQKVHEHKCTENHIWINGDFKLPPIKLFHCIQLNKKMGRYNNIHVLFCDFGPYSLWLYGPKSHNSTQTKMNNFKWQNSEFMLPLAIWEQKWQTAWYK